MRRAIGSTVQRIARLEAHWHGMLARQIHNFLNPWTTGAAGDQNAVECPACAKRFSYRMDTGQNARTAFPAGR
jgi:hypothetical protein